MACVCPYVYYIVFMKKYFHELSDDEHQAVLNSEITIGELNEKYMQPDWCGYPDALNGPMGCWSLVGVSATSKGRVKSESFCLGCECHASKENG